MNVGGMGVGARARDMRLDRRVAVCIDSLPPFRMAALPAGQDTFTYVFMAGRYGVEGALT
jgi:hypothetical protein